MANPTTNFGWVMPTSASLVTNLPADFNTFGQAVDTSMSELLGGTTGQVLSKTSNTNMDFTWVTPTDQTPLTTKGDLFTFTTVDARLGVGTNGYILSANSATATGLEWIAANPGDITGVTAGTGISGGGTSGDVTVTNSMATAMTTKGDLVPATGSGAFARLGVGANDTILTADSTAATGMKWATPSGGGGITQISSATMSGNSITLSSIPGTYKNLQIQLTNFYTSAGVQEIRLRFNGITAIDYSFGNVATGTSTVTGSGAIQTAYYSIVTTTRTSSDPYNAFNIIDVMDYTSTIPKFIKGQGYGTGTGGDAKSFVNGGSFYNAAAITSIEVYLAGATTFGGGTIKLLGVN